VLQGDKGKKLLGTVEVETAESVNNLEAMSQWATFSRLRAPFHLYVPAQSIDTAKRLCNDLQISVAEIWAYSAMGDQMRFTLIQRSAHASDGKRASAPSARPAAAAAPRRPAPAARRATSARPARRPAAASRTRATAAKTSKPSRGTGGTAKKASASRAQKRK
jgi:hypothetical protein